MVKVLTPLSVCAYAVLGLIVAAEDSAPKKQGEDGYYTRLVLIESIGSTCKPQFDPGKSEYDLVIDNPDAVNVTIRLVIDNARYQQGQAPALEIDGKEFRYNPYTVIAPSFELEKSVGVVTRLVTVRIYDPMKQKNVLGIGANEFTYKIRIVRPPDLKAIVHATFLHVLDAHGAELKNMPDTPKFSADSGETSYTYLFDETSGDQATIQIGCPLLPGTSMLSGGKEHTAQENITVDLTKSFSFHAQLICQYMDATFSPVPVQNSYLIAFRRRLDANDMYLTDGHLVLLAETGFCEEVYNISDPRFDDWKGDRTKVKKGFVCRTPRENARFVAVLKSNACESSISGVQYEDGTSEIVGLQPNVKVSVPVEEEKRIRNFKVVAGNLEANYPVLTFQAATCDSLPVPNDGLMHRDPNLENAESYMCKDRVCNLAADADVCFQVPATCERYALGCPKLKKMWEHPQKHFCRGLTCIKDDHDRCCEAEMKKVGDQVDYQGSKAVVTKSWMVGQHNRISVVIESTRGVVDGCGGNATRLIDPPTFHKGERVIVSERNGVIAKANDDDQYEVKFDDGSQHVHPSTEIRKDPDYWSGHELLGKSVGPIDRVITPLEDISFEVLVEGKAGTSTMLGSQLGDMKMLPFFQKDMAVRVDGKAGTVREDCGGGHDLCSIVLDGGIVLSPVPDEGIALEHMPVVLHTSMDSFKPHETVYIDGDEATVKKCDGKECEVTMALDGTVVKAPHVKIAKSVSFGLNEDVFVGSRKGKIIKACDNLVKCTVQFDDGSISSRIPALLLVRTNEGFVEDELVIVNGRIGRIVKHDCGGATECSVALADTGVIEKYWPTSVVRQEAFPAGQKVVANNKEGKIVKLCNSRTKCGVDFDDGSKSATGLDTSILVRVGAVEQGQEIELDHRTAVTLSACFRFEKCEVMFLDGRSPQTEQVLYSAIVSQNSFLKGTEYTRDGTRVVIVRRTPERELVATFKKDISQGKLANEKSHKDLFMETGTCVAFQPRSPDKEAGDIGLVNRLVDPFMPRVVSSDGFLVKGDRVIVAGMPAVVMEREGLDHYRVFFQDDGHPSGFLSREELSAVDAEFMIGDRVEAFGQVGTVITNMKRRITDEQVFVIKFDADGSLSALLGKEQMRLVAHLAQIGDDVYIQDKRATVEAIDASAGTYTVIWREEMGKASGPLKPWQVAPANEYADWAHRIVAGDEVRLMGSVGIVRSGPDDNNHFKVSLFEDGLNQFDIDRKYLTLIEFQPQEFDLESGHFKLGDKVECVSGSCRGRFGVITDLRMDDGCSVLFSGDDIPTTEAKQNLERLAKLPTYGAGSRIYLNGMAAHVVYGPDNRGGYLAKFDDSGLTGGPYFYSDIDRQKTLQRADPLTDPAAVLPPTAGPGTGGALSVALALAACVAGVAMTKRGRTCGRQVACVSSVRREDPEIASDPLFME